MKEANLYLMVYDISNDRERYRVEKTLKGYGFRVQKSVFECRLTKADKLRLMQALHKLLIKTGSVRGYRVYAGAPVLTAGKYEESCDAGFVYVL